MSNAKYRFLRGNQARPMFAIPHDGTLDGDSNFLTPGNEVTYKRGMSLDDVREAYKKQQHEDLAGTVFNDDDDISERVTEIKGAWIVSAETMEVLRAIVKAIDPGDDSSLYNCNKACKSVAQKLAWRMLGTWAE